MLVMNSFCAAQKLVYTMHARHLDAAACMQSTIWSTISPGLSKLLQGCSWPPVCLSSLSSLQAVS